MDIDYFFPQSLVAGVNPDYKYSVSNSKSSMITVFHSVLLAVYIHFFNASYDLLASVYICRDYIFMEYMFFQRSDW